MNYIVTVKNEEEVSFIFDNLKEIWHCIDNDKESKINFLKTHYVRNEDFPVNLIFNEDKELLFFEEYGVDYKTNREITLNDVLIKIEINKNIRILLTKAKEQSKNKFIILNLLTDNDSLDVIEFTKKHFNFFDIYDYPSNEENKNIHLEEHFHYDFATTNTAIIYITKDVNKIEIDTNKSPWFKIRPNTSDFIVDLSWNIKDNLISS